MHLKTLIISDQAHQLTEMLPGASNWGYICFHKSNDLPAAQTAVELLKAKAIILTPQHVALVLAILNLTTALCFFKTPSTLEVKLNETASLPASLDKHS